MWLAIKEDLGNSLRTLSKAIRAASGVHLRATGMSRATMGLSNIHLRKGRARALRQASITGILRSPRAETGLTMSINRWAHRQGSNMVANMGVRVNMDLLGSDSNRDLMDSKKKVVGEA